MRCVLSSRQLKMDNKKTTYAFEGFINLEFANEFKEYFNTFYASKSRLVTVTIIFPNKI